MIGKTLFHKSLPLASAVVGATTLAAGNKLHRIREKDSQRPHHHTTVIGNGMNGSGCIANACLRKINSSDIFWASRDEVLSSMSGPRNFGLSRCSSDVHGAALAYSLEQARAIETEFERITGKPIQIVQVHANGLISICPQGSSMDQEMQVGVTLQSISSLSEQDAKSHFPHLNLDGFNVYSDCLLYTSPSPRDQRGSRMPSSA